MKGRSIKLLAAIGSALVILLAACSNIVEKDGKVIMNTKIPPIDKYQPAQIETATFALG